MRHRVVDESFQRTTSHHAALFCKMAALLIKLEQITTTTAKAKKAEAGCEKVLYKLCVAAS
jgi:large subunit ribosomal protein L17